MHQHGPSWDQQMVRWPIHGPLTVSRVLYPRYIQVLGRPDYRLVPTHRPIPHRYLRRIPHTNSRQHVDNPAIKNRETFTAHFRIYNQKCVHTSGPDPAPRNFTPLSHV